MKSLHDVKNAPAKRTGGRNTVNTMAGSSMSGGKPGKRLSARLPATRKISVGIRMRRAHGTDIVVRKRSNSVAVTNGMAE